MRNSIYFLIGILFLFSCKSVNTDQSGVVSTINIPDALTNAEVLKLSDISKNVTYIPLETNDESLIGNIRQLGCDDDYLFILDETNIVKIFDRKGVFIRNINRIGRGPEEYLPPVSLEVDQKNKTILLSSRDAIFKYDYYGKFLDKISFPKLDNGYIVSNPQKMGDDYIASLSSMGPIEYGAIIFGSTDNVKKMIPRKIVERKIEANPDGTARPFIIQPTRIYSNKETPRIFYPESDLILSVNNRYEVDTIYRIDYGNYGVPDGYVSKATIDKPYISVISIIESEKYLFMTLLTRSVLPGTTRSYLLYNKKLKSSKMLYDQESGMSGFKDDTYDKIDFWPNCIYKNQLISYISADDLESNPIIAIIEQN